MASGLEGALGDGLGKWRLDVESTVSIRVMTLVSSPTGHLTNLSTVPAQESGGIHRVPLFPPASDPYGRQGFARVVNRSDVAGEVHIEAFDDTTRTYEALTLSMGARQTRHFNSTDLEVGNADKGLTGSTGAGEGDWRLELTSELDIEVLSYVRTVGGYGYVTPMHDTASQETGGLMRYYVPVFHPAGYDGQESRLHLVNLGAADAQVGISGLDDAGRPPPQGDVSLVIAGEATRVLTAEQLQDGDVGLDGRFGAGSGSWRLFVTAEGRLQVMSLGYSSDGFLANLSRGRPPAQDVVVSRPDLVVGTPTVSDSAPVAGALFTLSARVTNQGGGDAEATTLRYYRSTNAAISPSDVEVGTDRVDALSASGGSGESVAVSAPSEAGTYHYGACVDAVDGESDTTNNCSPSVSVRVSEPAGQPDLVVGSPSVSDSRPEAGEAFTLSATVRNSGEAASASTTLRYYRSANAIISTAGTQVGTDAVIALGPAGSSGESIGLNAPSDAGMYYYGACVDAVAGESDESNNCSPSIAVTVTQPRPDLSLQPPTVNNPSPGVGDPFTLSVTVRNGGDGASGATTLRYYRSDVATISTMDVPEGTDAVPGLAVQDSSSQTIALHAPTDAGTYYYGACVDPVADESDTANNCSSAVSVTVPDAATDHPDLIVESPSVSDDRPARGAAFELLATVRNAGSGDAAATTLHYYRSADATISTSDTPMGTDPVAALAASDSSSESITLNALTDAGTYYYGACVDAVVDESDTANNCSVSVEVTVEEPRHPDLVVGTPTVSEDNPQTGEDFTLSAPVTNQGDADAEATRLHYYRSTDATISTSDTAVGTDPVAALSVSGSSSHSITVVAPSTAGTYHYGACVDAVTDESDTANNCSVSVEVTVEAPKYPDLVVGTPTVSEDNPQTGGDFTLSAPVTNQGEAGAEATTLHYYRSTDATISTSDTAMGTDPVAALSVSGSSSHSITVVAPSTAGTYHYGACVDAVTDESDTANNCSGPVQVTVEVPKYLDLVVGTPTVSDDNPDTGGTFTLWATVENQGDGDADATTLRYYQSTDAAISTSDMLLVTGPVAALAASGSGSYSALVTAPFTAGTYYYGACVDTVDNESDSTNNCSVSVAVTVSQALPPDLMVESPLVSDQTPAHDTAFTLSATVRNQGTGDAGATTLRYYQSADATITTSDNEVGTDAVDGLAASGSSGESIELTAPSVAGTYYYGACVDRVANESDTTNNCSSSIRVTVPGFTSDGPDLVVPSYSEDGR